MAEYIDIEPLRKQIVEFKTAVKQFAKSSSFLKAYISGIDAVMEAIDKLPTADVQEVKRGYWKSQKSSGFYRLADYECSICGYDNDETPYCAFCGAKMEGFEE